MSLKHALLGFLNYGPMTGYEIKKFFDTSIAHFWNAELSQIYPTLKQAQAEGLVEMNVDVQADRPNRKVYSITDDGRRELIDWLAKSTEPDQIRDPLLMKVFFAASLPKQEIVQVLRHRVEEHERAIHSYERGYALIRKFAEAIGLEREAFFWALTLDAGLKYCQGGIEWAQEAIRNIEQLDESALATQRAQASPMDVRKAMEILEKLKVTMPEASASAHRAALKGYAS